MRFLTSAALAALSIATIASAATAAPRITPLMMAEEVPATRYFYAYPNPNTPHMCCGVHDRGVYLKSLGLPRAAVVRTFNRALKRCWDSYDKFPTIVRMNVQHEAYSHVAECVNEQARWSPKGPQWATDDQGLIYHDRRDDVVVCGSSIRRSTTETPPPVPPLVTPPRSVEQEVYPSTGKDGPMILEPDPGTTPSPNPAQVVTPVQVPVDTKPKS